jgi:hypothetical protein
MVNTFCAQLGAGAAPSAVRSALSAVLSVDGPPGWARSVPDEGGDSGSSEVIQRQSGLISVPDEGGHSGSSEDIQRQSGLISAVHVPRAPSTLVIACHHEWRT